MYFQYLIKEPKKLMDEKRLNEFGEKKWKLIDTREVEVQEKVKESSIAVKRTFTAKRWRHTFIKEMQ